MSFLDEAVAQPHFPTSIETSIKDKNQQHHQPRSLPKGQIANDKILLAVRKPWRQYKLSTDTNVCILTGSSRGNSGIAVNLMRNKKLLLSYCVAALSYARIYSERNWKPDDIDKIVDIGWNINRRASMKRPMSFEHKTGLGVQVTDVFYIDSIKFVTLTRAAIATGTVEADDLTAVNDFFSLLLENGQQACVVELNKNYFAFWSSDDRFFMFQPMALHQKSPQCVEFSSFDCVQAYLQTMFVGVESKLEYAFHLLDILKINNRVLSEEVTLKDFRTSKGDHFPEESLGLGTPHKMCLMPSKQNAVQTSYESLTESQQVLRCPKSIDRSAKISSTCVAAIVVLRVDKASSWTSDTLTDILAMGSKIYKENLKSKPKAQTDIRVADITAKIQYRSFQCLIESQQIFFGKVESSVANICNIEQGLSQFFLVHLAGVIDGPNVVAVWKENNSYYMYDAKSRNRFGRKLTKDETAAGENGMSCVTRFQQLTDLAETYVENVSHKERQEYYKITHIELKPFLGKNWYQWIVALPGQWCLRGEECLKPKENLRASVTALLWAENVSVKNWKAKTIDEIVLAGTQKAGQFKGERNVKEMQMEISFEEKASFVSIKQKMFRYVVNELDKNIEDGLVKGFTMFFEGNRHGIFSFNLKKTWKYFSVWKSSSSWFAFGVHLICDAAAGNEKKEAWCASRFTSPIDMVKSLTANITICKSQEFSLSPVNLNEEDTKMDRKKLKNYKTLEVTKGCAGILRIGKNFDFMSSEEDYAAVLKNTYNITAVIAMTLIKDCWTWSNYDVWDILKISQKSYSAEFKELRKFSIKIGSSTVKITEIQTFSAEKEGELEENKSSADQWESGDADAIENGGLVDDRLAIEWFINKFAKHDFPNAILRSKHFQLALWKKDGAFFTFDPRDADETGAVAKDCNISKSTCPYVAWFDSMNGLSEHLCSHLCETKRGSYELELILFKLKTKIENSNQKTWYNFSPVNDISNQWMIRSLYGTLQYQYSAAGCIIAIAFASTLQPSNWNSSMLDSALKYGMKLYKQSRNKANSTEIKLNTIVTPFIIGCYEFSFTARLLICGTNERNDLENGIASLFNHADFGVISSKGYSAAIWQQNNSYFIFDPQLNGTATLSRFSDITLISQHFLSHVRTGMTGVNVFEIFKISISRNIIKKKDCPSDVQAISRLTNRSIPMNDTDSDATTLMFNSVSSDPKWSEIGDNLPAECVLVAASVLGCYKNPQYWTANLIDEILRLGKNIFRTTIEKLNLNSKTEIAGIQTDQIHGVYPFDGNSAINIRIEVFDATKINQPNAQHESNVKTENVDTTTDNVKQEVTNAQHESNVKTENVDTTTDNVKQEVTNAQHESNVKTENVDTTTDNVKREVTNEETTVSDHTKAALTSFFEHYENGFLSTKIAAVTAWKDGGRFYLFNCQPVRNDGNVPIIGVSRGVLQFMNLDELYAFLKTSFGNDSDLNDWLEIRSLKIDPVPIENLYLDQERIAAVKRLTRQPVVEKPVPEPEPPTKINSKLMGKVCRCSSDEQGHREKHAALSFAAIVLSNSHDPKTWTAKSLRQIEVIGNILYEDGVVDAYNQANKNVKLPEMLFIDQDVYQFRISPDGIDHPFNATELAVVLERELATSSTIYIAFNERSFTLIQRDQIFYFYDPNGVDDEQHKIRATVTCFREMEPLAFHISGLGNIIENVFDFQAYYVISERN